MMTVNPKSGPHRIGDDWQGYFLCGQQAIWLAPLLTLLADNLEQPRPDPELKAAAARTMRDLAARFASCREASRPRDAA